MQPCARINKRAALAGCFVGPQQRQAASSRDVEAVLTLAKAVDWAARAGAAAGWEEPGLAEAAGYIQ